MCTVSVVVDCSPSCSCVATVSVVFFKNEESIETDTQCHMANMPLDFKSCAFVIQAWAIGGGVRNKGFFCRTFTFMFLCLKQVSYLGFKRKWSHMFPDSYFNMKKSFRVRKVKQSSTGWNETIASSICKTEKFTLTVKKQSCRQTFALN